MRIALVNPPWMYKRLYTHSIYPPYGLLMIATLLQRDGHDIRLIDANAHDLTDDDLRAQLIAFDPHALGVTVFTDTFGFLERTGVWWREAFGDRPFVLGGSLVSGAPETVMRGANADIAVLNEGFVSAPALFERLARGADFRDVPGLMVRDGEGFAVTGPTPVQPDLDALPWPDWDLLPVRMYIEGKPSPYFEKRRLQHYLSIATTLGCPWACTFCQVPALFGGVRCRTPDSVAREVRSYVDKYGIESMYFRDDILFRPGKIAAALGREVPGLEWSCLLRADMMTKGMMARMYDGGCREVRVGFESGDDGVLELANKKTAVADNIRSITLARDAGIAIAGFMIVGLPGESEASLANTERFVRETGARVSVHFPLPLPGTELYRQGRESGLIDDEAALLRLFSQPQLPGAVLQPPAVNYTDLPDDVLVHWAMRIADVGRTNTEVSDVASGTAPSHADAPF